MKSLITSIAFLGVIISTNTRHVKFTYYWLADQAHYRGKADTEIEGCDGEILAMATKKFVEILKFKCFGRLIDGRILNGGDDDCTCFDVVDAPKGSNNNNLVPFVSVACNDEEFGKICYVKELDGLKLPKGDVHNGCVRVDDKSWSFGKNHIDFYVYKKSFYEFCNEEGFDKVHFDCNKHCNLQEYKF